MANLIPPSAKKQVRLEYWIRVVSVWLCVFGTALLVVSALNAPVYLLVRNQLAVYSQQFSGANEQTEAYKKIETEILESNKMATLLASEKQTTSFVGLLKELDTLSGRSVEITSFSFARSGNKIEAINISGVATNRQSLVAFSDIIEEQEKFDSAEIPLSNLAKDKDIPFTITIIPATNTE